MELETLRSDMIAAMKAKRQSKKRGHLFLISAAKKVAIDEGCRDDIKPELVDRVILKRAENRKRTDRHLPGIPRGFKGRVPVPL